MIRRLPRGSLIAGSLLLISGLLIFTGPALRSFYARTPILFTIVPILLWLVPPLIIQLLQGGARPFLGWLGIGLLLAYILAIPAIPLARTSSKIPVLLVMLLMPIIGFALLGVSMIRTRYFPRNWGRAVAVTGIVIVLGGFPIGGILYALLGLRELRRPSPPSPPPSDGSGAPPLPA